MQSRVGRVKTYESITFQSSIYPPSVFSGLPSGLSASLPVSVVKLRTLQHDNSPNGALRRAVGLMCIWQRRLLLNAFIFVEFLKRVGCELAGSVVSDELDLLAIEGYRYNPNLSVVLTR